jgi:hypothetical protein
MARVIREPTLGPMHASSMSEAGAFRIVLAVALAAAIVVGIGTALGVVAGIVAAAILVLAGVAFETRHMSF